MPNHQSKVEELKEANFEALSTNETAHSDTNAAEPRGERKIDFAVTGIISSTSDMHKAKTELMDSGVQGNRKNQVTPSKQWNKSTEKSESLQITASGSNIPSSTAGKAKYLGRNEDSTESSPKNKHNDNKNVCMSATLRDQSTTGSPNVKSKIPKRSMSEANVKSQVTASETSVADASGSVVTHKQQKQRQENGKKISFVTVPAKKEKAPSGNNSTKIPKKTGEKQTVVKSDSAIQEQEEITGKTPIPHHGSPKKGKILYATRHVDCE